MNDTRIDKSPLADELLPFDAEKALVTYRRAFNVWERTGAGQIGLKLMRRHWQDRHGEDSLHRIAFERP